MFEGRQTSFLLEVPTKKVCRSLYKRLKELENDENICSKSDIEPELCILKLQFDIKRGLY